MTTKLRLLALALAAWPLPALATETVVCIAPDDPDVAVEMNLGSVTPPAMPNWLRVTTIDEAWSTLDFDDVTAITVRQSFDDGQLMSIDAVAPDLDDLVIAIRLLSATEGDLTVQAGTLHIVGQSIHPLICDLGES